MSDLKERDLLADGTEEAMNSLRLIRDAEHTDQWLAKGDTPLYRRLSEGIRELISKGVLTHGTRLPAVRDLADSLDLSKGTVKHAYNLLADSGVLSQTQGKGSFVELQDALSPDRSRKEQAMEAIEEMLLTLQELGFSKREVQIFLELKLREQEAHPQDLKVAIFCESPEERTVALNELSALPAVELFAYPAEELLSGLSESDLMDLIVTTEEPFFTLKNNPSISYAHKLCLLGLTAHPQTYLDLANVQEEDKVGVLTVSKSFSRKILEGCAEYLPSGEHPKSFLFQEKGLSEFFDSVDLVIMPADYMNYMTESIQAEWKRFKQKGGKTVLYRMNCERASLLDIRARMEDLLDEKSRKYNVS